MKEKPIDSKEERPIDFLIREINELRGKEKNNDPIRERPIDLLFRELSELRGKEILIITQTSQLNLLGQTFRPIFCGEIAEVSQGHVTLHPVTIKMVNAPFYRFPLPISIPFERIASFSAEVGCDTVFPLT